METITNAASTAAATVSNLIYGQPAAKNNETAGQEPLSGQQGKGTTNEPFDQGNAVPATTSPSTSNATTDATSGDFLKLNPTVGTSSTTESSADTHTGTTGVTSLPIIPLTPDAETRGSDKTTATSTSQTGITDKAGVSDTLWKPTPLDEVKPSGAPGAGPEAPSSVTPAVPEGYSGTSTKSEEPVAYKFEDLVAPKSEEPVAHKVEESVAPKFEEPVAPKSEEPVTHKVEESVAPKFEEPVAPKSEEPVAGKVEAAKDSATTTNTSETKDAASSRTNSINPAVDAILTGSTPKGKHSVPEVEAADPHSKMENKTERQADKSKPDPAGEAKVVDSSAHKTESSKAEPASPTGGEDKDGKMSHIKEKLKNKLHIGSKDK